MARTTKFFVSFLLTIPLVALAGQRVMAANHAPVLNASKSPVLAPECQNAGAPSGAVGTLKSSLVDFAVPSGQVDNVTDSDAGAKLGIAVTAADTSNGSWWYSKNNGANWYALGSVKNSSARLLAADANTRLYFKPNTDYYGTLATAITFRAWDQTSGTNGSLAGTTLNGGSRAFSTATDTASLLVVWVPPLDPPPPVEYHVTFVDNLPGSTGTELFAMDEFGTAMGRGRVSADSSYRAVKWTLSGGLEDVSSLAEPWYDLEINEFVEGWIARSIRDFNSQGQTVGAAYDGTSIRAYVHDDVFGYSLLPRIDASVPHEAWVINNQGEIQGQILGGSFRTFFWSPTNPGVISVMGYWPRGMNDQSFLVWDSVESNYKLFCFLFVDGSLLYELVTSISGDLSSIMDDSGYFTYLTDGGTTQTLWLYRPAQSALKVSESASLTLVRPWKVNSSGDFVYTVAGVPYLYRHSELRSYRLYDLSDSYTKSTLFVDTSGQLKYAQNFQSVTSDDDVSGTPSTDPFDSITGWLNTSGVYDSVVLTPIPK